MTYRNILGFPFIMPREGEEEAAKAAKAAAAAKAAEEAAEEAAAETAKKFTPEQQEILNRELANQKRKFQETIAGMQTKLKEANLSAQQREALETELESARATLRSKEEQATHDKTALERKHARDLQKITEERDSWKSQFTQAQVQRDLTDAAVGGESFNPSQVVAILHPNASLINTIDAEGKPTGSMQTQVKMNFTDDKGKPIEVIGTPGEIVKRMKESSDQFGNLFKDPATGGVGGSPNAKSGGPLDLAAIAKDPIKYREARAKGKLPHQTG